MKKALIIVLIGLISGSVSAQLTVPIDVAPVPTKVKVVEQAVKPAVVAVKAIVITFDAQGQASVIVAWEWRAADGTVLKRGTRTFTEADIAPYLEASGSSLAALKAMFAGIAKADAEAP